MGLIFFGTSSFAASLLERLVQNGVKPLAIVTRPDRCRGRDQKLLPPPVKEKALHLDRGVPIYQPEKASTEEFSALLKEHQPTLFIVVAYGEILKPFLLDIPTYGAFNLHTSLLPKYRGAAPIQRAILNGEKISGVTLIEMIDRLDAGDMVGKKEVTIEGKTAGEVENLFLEPSLELLIDLIGKVREASEDSQRGKRGSDILLKKERQDEEKASYAAKIQKEERCIDWKSSSKAIYQKILALNPAPVALGALLVEGTEEKKGLKIFHARPCDMLLEEVMEVGQFLILDKKRLIVQCGEGLLELLEVQMEGKKRLPIWEFIQGVKGRAGQFLA